MLARAVDDEWKQRRRAWLGEARRAEGNLCTAAIDNEKKHEISRTDEADRLKCMNNKRVEVKSVYNAGRVVSMRRWDECGEWGTSGSWR